MLTPSLFLSCSVIRMGVEDLIGASAKAEAGGLFDPLKLSEGKDDETLAWYRSAELKHGRVAMLATLGVVTTSIPENAVIIPGFPVKNLDAFAALGEVYEKNPSALLQIVLVISALEVLGASIESKTRPGDFGWDPANIRPSDPEQLDILQTKELKNGRLAMLGISGMALAYYQTGHVEYLF